MPFYTIAEDNLAKFLTREGQNITNRDGSPNTLLYPTMVACSVYLENSGKVIWYGANILDIPDFLLDKNLLNAKHKCIVAATGLEEQTGKVPNLREACKLLSKAKHRILTKWAKAPTELFDVMISDKEHQVWFIQRTGHDLTQIMIKHGAAFGYGDDLGYVFGYKYKIPYNNFYFHFN